MSQYRLLGLFALALVPAASTLACTTEVAQDDGGEDALRQRQYQGRELPSKTLSFTFDDGPGDRTGELSKYLKEQGIPSVFFMMGKNAQGKDALLSQIVADGHLIANHSWSHQQLTAIGNQSVIDEVTKADNVLSPFYSGNMYMFRAPYGAWNARVSTALNGTPQKRYVGSIFWDNGGDMTNGYTADWACWGSRYNYSAEKCGAGYMAEIAARGRGVVLLHDIHSRTVDMVKWMVPQLKAQGYKFVRTDVVPSINADLRAAGATPLPALPITSNPASNECSRDAVLCGATIQRDPSTLYRCENRRLHPVCTCRDVCRPQPVGTPDECTCNEGT